MSHLFRLCSYEKLLIVDDLISLFFSYATAVKGNFYLLIITAFLVIVTEFFY